MSRTEARAILSQIPQAEVTRDRVSLLAQEYLQVLSDALLESDVPELGEELALALNHRNVMPGAARGLALKRGSSPKASRLNARNLYYVFYRVDDELSFPTHREREAYDRRELQAAQKDLRDIQNEWRRLPPPDRTQTMNRLVDQLEQRGLDDIRAHATWLFDGTYGPGVRLIAQEILRGISVDLAAMFALQGVRSSSASYIGSSHIGSELALFQLVLMLDERIGSTSADAVYRRLPSELKSALMYDMREVLGENGHVFPEDFR